MDTTWVLLPLSALLLIALTFVLHRKKNNNGNLPPSPPGIPIVGNLLSLRKSLLEISPALRRLRPILGPVVTLNLGIFPAIFIIDRHLTHQALVQKGVFFSDRPPTSRGGATFVYSSNGHIITSAGGGLWRLLRRNLASEIIHPSRVKTFSGSRRWVLSRLLGVLREKAGPGGGGVVLLPESIRHAIFELLIFMCFGEKLKDEVIQNIEEIQKSLLHFGLKINVFDIIPVTAKILMWRTWRRFLQTRRRQEELLIPMIRARREATDQEDGSGGVMSYIDSLLRLELPEEGDRKLTEEETVSLVSEFLNAGTDTTAGALEWAMANVVKHPHVQQKLVEEINGVVKEGEEIQEEDLQSMPYLKAVILETLRRHPPAQLLLPHAVSEEVELGGYVIPKGAVVNFAVAEMGWDGVVWEEPFEFRPERFMDSGGEGAAAVDLTGSREIKMMPFGVGRRICPGLGLAMLHLEYLLANLVREFEWKVAEEGTDVDLSEKLEFTVVMKNPLRARIFPRSKRTVAPSDSGGLSSSS